MHTVNLNPPPYSMLRSGPHSISLKVLRLSRPSLATQVPLPGTDFGNGLDVDIRASLAYPSGDITSSFPLAPALTLPNSFGLAYVGELFACTLCVNNELDDDHKSVSAIKVTAELQTPSEQQGKALELKTLSVEQDGSFDLGQERTIQFNLRHDLKEAGPHVLAVTVTYTETTHAEQGDATATGGKVRTFRKLYQFVAQHLISVRSKITERKTGQKESLRQWIVEAQLENVGENSVVLEDVSLKERDGVNATSCSDAKEDVISLKPQDIQQVMFVVKELTQHTAISKRQLGQVVVSWRGAMGEPGKLTTGWLTSKT
ncbi:hypothetical protein AMS68_003794 [Peltaster fructicola]|uniref:Trafficking protein particle complex subunit 13 n=1 Tax=Peltaster fructicola TaxID=286661 RepID=A0A6H0XU29_9PEZI|nr:hypothetical protein AMS68_003794 [Peltaster fructicola]